MAESLFMLVVGLGLGWLMVRAVRSKAASSTGSAVPTGAPSPKTAGTR